MRTKLSPDVWRDYFDWLHKSDRRQLALKSNKVKDPEFSYLCQRWLHGWSRNVQLNELYIRGPQPMPEPKETAANAQIAIVESARLQCLYYNNHRDLLLIDVPFAETELPENIRDFRAIEFSYLDTKVLKFMRRLQPLFRDIILKLYDFEFSLETAQAALDHCMPLFTGGIDTISIYHHPQLVFIIRDRFPTQFLAIKKLHLWTDDISFSEFMNYILPWLHTNREDGEPRMLLLTMFRPRDNNYAWNVESIRKQFLNATRPVSFCICLWKWKDGIPYRGVEQESITQNARTGEQLVVRQDEDGLSIRRCSSELNGLNWIEEMHKKNEAYTMEEKRVISISNPITIGPIEEANPKEEEQNEEVDVDQQPGPSTKRRK